MFLSSSAPREVTIQNSLLQLLQWKPRQTFRSRWAQGIVWVAQKDRHTKQKLNTLLKVSNFQSNSLISHMFVLMCTGRYAQSQVWQRQLCSLISGEWLNCFCDWFEYAYTYLQIKKSYKQYRKQYGDPIIVCMSCMLGLFRNSFSLFNF